MKKGCIFIILLWSFCCYGGLFSSFGNTVRQICSKGFWGGGSQVVDIKTDPKEERSVEVSQKEEEVSSSFFVLVVRHASYHGTTDVKGMTREQAEALGLSDIRLPLSKEGRDRFKEMCKARNFCSFDLLIHSSSVRAWETANIFAEHFTVKERRISDNLTEYRSEPEDILQEIRDSNVNTVVLVGHQPSLTKFLSKVLDKEDATMARILLDGYGNMIPLKFSSWDLGSAKLQF